MDWRKITFETEAQTKRRNIDIFLSKLSHEERRILVLISEMRSEREIKLLTNCSGFEIDELKKSICKKLNINGSYTLIKFAFINKKFLSV